MFSSKTLVILLALVALLASKVAVAQVPSLTPNLEWKGRLVVQFTPALEPIHVNPSSNIVQLGDAGLDALARQYAVYRISKFIPGSEKPQNPSIPDLSRFYILEFPEKADLHTVCRAYAAHPLILSAESYYVQRPCYTPNDLLYPQQWALPQIQIETAYDYCQGSEDVIVGIVDSGIDTAHLDLRGNLWVNPGEDLNGNGVIEPEERNRLDDDANGFIDDFWGWNTWQNNNNVQDTVTAGHGTFCAGCASAVTDNLIGIASPGWKAKLMTIRAGDGMFIYAGYQGVVYCADNGADVINLSWGGASYSVYGQSVVNYAWSLGAVVVAAAGNDGLSYPAAYEHVFAVGATDQNDHKASFSNYGSWVDVFAPGVNILGTIPGNAYQIWSGTSIAAPLASGLAALVRAAGPTLTNEQVLQQILTTSADIDSLNPGYSGLLRIDAGAAISGLFIDVELTPENPPIIIPAGGGGFRYNLEISNSDSASHSVDLWCMVLLPDSSFYGPILEPMPVSLPAGSQRSRNSSQRVPAHAPAGNYAFIAHIGDYPMSICGRDTIFFTKLASGDLDSPSYSSGLDAWNAQRGYRIAVNPNPFNASTVIRYKMQDARHVRLRVYDTAGRLVETLVDGWRQAGEHELTFDASNLPSGLYFAKLRAGDFAQTQKIVLMK